LKVVVDNDGPVRVSLTDLKGQTIKSVFEGKVLRGLHYYAWNGHDDAQKQVSSGIYFLYLNGTLQGKLFFRK